MHMAIRSTLSSTASTSRGTAIAPNGCPAASIGSVFPKMYPRYLVSAPLQARSAATGSSSGNELMIFVPSGRLALQHSAKDRPLPHGQATDSSAIHGAGGRVGRAGG